MNRGFFVYSCEEEKDSKVKELERYDLDDLRGAKSDNGVSLKFTEYLAEVCQLGDTVYVVSFSEIGCNSEEQTDALRYIIDHSIKIKVLDGIDDIVAVGFSAEESRDLMSLIQTACKAGWLI